MYCFEDDNHSLDSASTAAKNIIIAMDWFAKRVESTEK